MMRRVVRDLPAIKWRDEKIEEWRGIARQHKEALRAAEQRARTAEAELARLRAESQKAAKSATKSAAPAAPAEKSPAPAKAPAAVLPCGEPLLGENSTVTRDAAGTTPRVEFAPDLVKALKKAGHEVSSGTTPGDPRGYGSFATHLLEARRYRKRLGDQGLKNHPRREIPKKLQNFALAASHGVQPPTILAVWRKAEEIDLSGLPDEFVLKSNGGAGSRGVHPLRRVPGKPDQFEVADDTRRPVTGAEVIRLLTTDAKLTGPWFAEELLVPEDGAAGLPSDIKMFAFYGEVGFGFARRAPLHRGVAGWQDAQQFRYFDGEGRDVEMRTIRSVREVALSPQLPQMLEHARTLSAAVPLPFVRVDLYGTTKGVVMGEITLLPGSHTDLLPLQDMRLGRMWEEAEMRFQIDVAVKGRPYAILAGDHPVPELLKPYLPKQA
ncbi:ATP-grasp fold amidoligase family protein [Kytococcus sedentarius]|uniref:ATP-grasp fold amidoligase family protein n=1 Tax=Kytococcus sedentarius TaxID=1276 RepID=UPI0035BBCDF3